MAVTTGREVATGTLWISKEDNSKVRVRVAARCGTPDCTYQGQINIYDEGSSGHPGSISEPCRVINLTHINEVSSLNGSHPTFINASSSKRNSLLHSNDIFPQNETLWGFMLLLSSGEAVELFADTREQQQLWIKYLQLMSMFPFSPIPEEPRINPIRDSYRSRLKSSHFDADSVWLVYILSEEVGSRVHSLGVNVVTLQSALSCSKPARMTIISPLDNEPLVTWEANKMRRTGSLGNLVFLEIGRRCEGGPGLLWMYSTPEDSVSFRETITRFLFNGDARAVTEKPDPTLQYDLVSSTTVTVATNPVATPSNTSSPGSSGGSSFQLSFSAGMETPEKKQAVYDSAEYDYAYNVHPLRSNSMSGIPYGHVNSTNPLALSSFPPPVNLTTHPSRKQVHKRSLSNPPTVVADNNSYHGNNLSSAPLNHKWGSRDSGVATSITTLDDDFLEIDKSLSEIMTDLSSSSSSSLKKTSNDCDQEINNLEDVIASLEDMANDVDGSNIVGIKRSNTLPVKTSLSTHRRANSTSTCHPVHYLKHKKNKEELIGNNDYIVMKSAKMRAQPGPTLSPLDINYDFLDNQLSPIKEKGLGPNEYENYPPPEDVLKATPINYTVPYANVTTSGTAAVSFDDDDIYENSEPAPISGPIVNSSRKRNSSIKFESLINSTLKEMDNLQNALDQLGQC